MPPQLSNRKREGLKVFIVEDSVNVQAALQDLVDVLEGAAVVGVATSEALAIHWAESHPGGWDVAVVDLMLHEGDGFHVIRRLKERTTAGQVAVFSGFVTDVIRRHCEGLGADAVFRKTEWSELAAYIENLAGLRQDCACGA